MSRNPKAKTFDRPLELIRKTFLKYRSKFGLFFCCGLIVFMVTMTQLLAIRIGSLFLFFLSVVASVIVSYIVYIAEMKIANDPARLGLKQAFVSVESYLLPSAWVSVAIILIALGGTLLLVIPGIIVSLFMMFALFAVVVDHYEKTDAIIYSWELVKERWLGVFGRLIVANIVIGVLTLAIMAIFWFFHIGETPMQTVLRARAGDHSVSFSQTMVSEGVGNLFSLPIALIFVSELYEALKRSQVKELTAAKQKNIKKYLKALSMLGVVFIILGLFLSSLKLAQIVPQFIRLTHAPASVLSAF